MGTAIMPGWGTAIGAVAGGLFGGSKKKSVTLDPYAGMTPEQIQSMKLLQQFGATGQIGDFQAGQGYGNLGDFNFNMTGVENMGQDQLMNLLSSGTGSDMSTASRTLQEMANQKFNPDDPSSGFAAYSRQVARAGKTASDQLNQEAAMTGGRFGTGIQRQKTDLAAQMSDQLGSKLGELYGQTQNQKLQAASGLGNLAQAQDQMNQQRIQAAYTYGTRQRELQNQKAQLAYDDWTNARAERMKSISGLQTVLSKGTTPIWGGTTQEYSTPTGFQSFLNGMNGSSGGSGSSGIMSLLSMFGGGANNGASSLTASRTPSFMNSGISF
jgi:hypothetical protein